MASLVQRLFILGDPHIEPRECELWGRVIDDINALAPDQVLVLGDLTHGPQTGTPDGNAYARSVLDRLSVPWHTIIGNHDLQASLFATDAEAVGSFLSTVGRKTPWFCIDTGVLVIIGLSNTQWRDNVVASNEIVINDQQLAWFSSQLRYHADRPVVLLVHCPPIGSGLLTLSELHAAVGNAFANHNHRPSQLQRLLRDMPNVLFCFSGHNHMGQHYRDAITQRLGIHFIHTAVASRLSTRDGFRQSRVLDIFSDRIMIRTFDHTMRCIDDELEYCIPHTCEELLDYRRVIAGRRMIPMDPATMRQGPSPAVRASVAQRFAFLCDSHLGEDIGPLQERVIDWAGRVLRTHLPDRIVLGGDITRDAEARQAHAFLELLCISSVPIDYLPGDKEGRAFQLDWQRYRNVHGVCGCTCCETERQSHTFMLRTTDAREANDACEALLDQLPEDGPVLVFAHLPPGVVDQKIEDRLAAHDQKVFWICGHLHEHRTIERENLVITTCRGLDPIGSQSHLPELLLVDWDGSEVAVQTHRLPQKMLMHAAEKTGPA